MSAVIIVVVKIVNSLNMVYQRYYKICLWTNNIGAVVIVINVKCSFLLNKPLYFVFLVPFWLSLCFKTPGKNYFFTEQKFFCSFGFGLINRERLNESSKLLPVFGHISGRNPILFYPLSGGLTSHIFF